MEIYNGDCITLLKKMIQDNHKANLIYIDPPFGFKLDDKFENNNYNIEDQDNKTIVDNIIYMPNLNKREQRFLRYLYPRLQLMKDVLAEDGSIYVHLDQKMSHYVKIIMDEIFGKENFINEIIWHYKRGTASSNKFQNMHDVILYFGKSNLYVFNKITIDLENYLKERKIQRGWNSNTIKSKNGRKRQLIVYDKTLFDEAVKIGKINLSEGDNVVYSDSKEKTPDDVWEIPFINPVSNERVGYPTQKPEKLLERIIKASSNKGDLVLDCFAGSGTTGAVAEKLGRRGIMCDISPLACEVMKKRIKKLNK